MRTSKKTKKTATPKKPSSSKKRLRKIAAKPRQIVDDVLVKVSPQVQKRVDQLIATLQDTKEARMGDLKWLGGQILLRSREVSDQLKKLKVQPVPVAKKVMAKKTSAKKSRKK